MPASDLSERLGSAKRRACEYVGLHKHSLSSQSALPLNGQNGTMLATGFSLGCFGFFSFFCFGGFAALGLALELLLELLELLESSL